MSKRPNYLEALHGVFSGLGEADPNFIFNDFFKGFDMMPDVRSQLLNEFWKYGSLYQVIMKGTSAYERIKANIRFAMTHQGNIVVEFEGRKRHGKSTQARWLARLRHKMHTGHVEGWEEKVNYEQSYSGSTNRIKELGEHLWEMVQAKHTEYREQRDAFLAAIRGYLSMQDENWIEHHEDSKRAENDLKNLVRTVASAGIDFFFITTVSRMKEVDFRLKVVGIDKTRKLTISLYYDNDGECHGALITPYVAETEKYTDAKNDGVVELLLKGGRRPAERKAVGEEKGTGEPTRIEVPPDADFMQTLESCARSYLQPLVKKPEIVERWILRYFHGKTYSEISKILDIKRADTVGDSIRDLEARISKTLKGDILEVAACDYLNRTLLGDQWLNKESELQNTKLSEDFRGGWRRGWRGCDVAVPGRVAVNCKWIGEVRSSYHELCLPEAEILPGRAYLLACVVTPGERWHHIHQCTRGDGHTKVSRTPGSSDNFVPWEEWLERMKELIAPASAESVPSVDASDPVGDQDSPSTSE